MFICGTGDGVHACIYKIFIIQTYLFWIKWFCRVRFHYGHPDVFDRIFHLTRGGVSKASKVINLSEDIFAGKLMHVGGPFIIVYFATVNHVTILRLQFNSTWGKCYTS